MGNRGPSPKPKPAAAIAFRRNAPPAPPWLDAAAAAEYKRAATELEAAGVATQVDLSVLATYAQAYADVARLTLEIRKEGEIITLPNGIQTENPKSKTLAKADRRRSAAVQALGFSPASRGKVQRQAQEKAENPFLKFVK